MDHVETADRGGKRSEKVAQKVQKSAKKSSQNSNIIALCEWNMLRPQTGVGRGAAVAPLSFQRTNPLLQLHCTVMVVYDSMLVYE